MISESTITRLDLIWNTYPDQNLTRLTQDKRGCRTKVQVSTPIPAWWLEQFVKIPENKADLSRFIGQEIVNDLITFPWSSKVHLTPTLP